MDEGSRRSPGLQRGGRNMALYSVKGYLFCRSLEVFKVTDEKGKHAFIYLFLAEEVKGPEI